MKLKSALLLCLMAAAVLAVGGAWRSLHRTGTPALPEEIAARFAGREESAAYYLRDDEGRVAVYEGRRGREKLAVTAIETANLRLTDRTLLRRGIPVTDADELLRLLEDLGS